MNQRNSSVFYHLLLISLLLFQSTSCTTLSHNQLFHLELLLRIRGGNNGNTEASAARESDDIDGVSTLAEERGGDGKYDSLIAFFGHKRTMIDLQTIISSKLNFYMNKGRDKLSPFYSSSSTVASKVAKDIRHNFKHTRHKMETFKDSSFNVMHEKIEVLQEKHLLSKLKQGFITSASSTIDFASSVRERSNVAFGSLLAESKHNEDAVLILTVFIVSLVGTSIGFRSYLYFVSVGQSLSIGLLTMISLIAFNAMSNNSIPILTNIHSCLVLIWSIRLTCFLLHREYVNWPQRHEQLIEIQNQSKTESKFSIWLTCSSLYAMMIMPCIYRLKAATPFFGSPLNNSGGVESMATATPVESWGPIGKIGIGLQFLGLSLESIADYQKGSFKSRFHHYAENGGNDDISWIQRNEREWCDEGLWNLSTHPNYLGEIMFWIGTYLGSIGCFSNLFQWSMCTVGLLFTLIVMKSAIDSLDFKQFKTYGFDEDFLEYKRTHSIFGPFRIYPQKEYSITL